ncbi:MAG: translation initiation factor IF-1 [bacterium]|nr:translation initiation factor IF-1 [bacterium]
MEKVVVEGKIIESLPNAFFKVEIEGGYHVHAYLSGKLRMNYIKIVPGDRVKVELSPYDPKKGRIISRIDIEKKNDKI